MAYKYGNVTLWRTHAELEMLFHELHSVRVQLRACGFIILALFLVAVATEKVLQSAEASFELFFIVVIGDDALYSGNKKIEEIGDLGEMEVNTSFPVLSMDMVW